MKIQQSIIGLAAWCEAIVTQGEKQRLVQIIMSLGTKHFGLFFSLAMLACSIQLENEHEKENLIQHFRSSKTYLFSHHITFQLISCISRHLNVSNKVS